jgi:hypothetical protein
MHQRRRNADDQRRKAWLAMRTHKRFTSRDIESTAGITFENLKKYLKALRRSGYLMLERPRQSGKTMGHAIWRLVRCTGPLNPLPRWDGTGVWDQNEQKLYPYGEEGSDERRLARRTAESL